MALTIDPKLAARLQQAAQNAGLDLLVLFGSRARQQARPDSDWDLGFLSKHAVDQESLRESIAVILNASKVDLVDLNRSNGLLRYFVAAEGVLIYERVPGAFLNFRQGAVRFWCDAEPVLSRAYEEVLAKLRAA